MTHQLYEIWHINQSSWYPWRAQMKNYVAQFMTEQQAQDYVKALQEIEARNRK